MRGEAPRPFMATGRPRSDISHVRPQLPASHIRPLACIVPARYTPGVLGCGDRNLARREGCEREHGGRVGCVPRCATAGLFRSPGRDPPSNVGDRERRRAPVDAIRPDFPRWARYVKENGVTEIPDSPLAGDFHAINTVSMLIRQKAGFKGDSIAHELRNLTGIRPWKPWLRPARIGPVAEPFTCRPDPPEAADANGARDPDPASAGPVPIRAGSGRPVSPVGADQTLSQGCGEMPRI